MPLGSRQLLTILSLATIGAAWWWARAATHGRAMPAAARTRLLFGLAPSACVLGLLVFAPIISPQYILWLLPWVAIAWASAPERWGVAATTLAVSALSTWSLASILGQIHGDLYATLPVLVRNLLLVGLLAVTLAELASRASQRSEPVTTPEDDVEHAAQQQH